MSIWIILGLAAMGIGAAIAAFLKTPTEKRYRLSAKLTMEEQLAACPKSADAVIIKANKHRFIIKLSPIIFWIILHAAFIFWSKHYQSLDCVTVAYANIFYICYLIPFLVFVFAVYMFRLGIKILKTGYFPPLDSAVFIDTIAKKGILSKIRGIGHLSLIFIAIYLVHLGNNLHVEFFKDADEKEIQANFKAQCN